jgi:hypothetical protein
MHTLQTAKGEKQGASREPCKRYRAIVGGARTRMKTLSNRLRIPEVAHTQ